MQAKILASHAPRNWTIAPGVTPQGPKYAQEQIYPKPVKWAIYLGQTQLLYFCK